MDAVKKKTAASAAYYLTHFKLIVLLSLFFYHKDCKNKNDIPVIIKKITNDENLKNVPKEGCS